MPEPPTTSAWGSPLQRVAMGMLVVILSAPLPAHPHPTWAHYDVLADPLGWLLVFFGMRALARADDTYVTARWLAVLAGAVSVPMWVPQLTHHIVDSGLWAASLPQIAFCLVLAREIGKAGAIQTPRDAYAAQRFGLLVWGFAIAAVLPVLYLGGGLQQLESPTQLVSILVNIMFIYCLFRVHRRPWLGGPGPLQIQPIRQRD